MNFRYAGVEFKGTRDEILKKLETAFPFELIDDRLCYGHETIRCNDHLYSHLDHVRMVLVQRIQDKVPQENYEIKIGDIVYHGTKKEIERNFLDAIRGVDVIFEGVNQFSLLGIVVDGIRGCTIKSVRWAIIGNVKRLIHDL